MNPNVSKIYDIEKDILGEPQEYKGIKFYPIKLLGESKYKNLFHNLLCYPKNTIPDKKVLKMFYLKFILRVMGFDKKDDLEDFLRHICRTDKIQILFEDIESLADIENIKFYIQFGDVKITEYEFDDIREIILQQNGSSIEYINKYDASLEEKMQFINKEFNELTFEENIFTFCCLSGLSISDLKDYTMYQFKKHSTRLSLWRNYEAFKPVEVVNPSKDGKEVIKHYLTHVDDNDRYGAILIKRKDFEEGNGKYFQ